MPWFQATNDNDLPMVINTDSIHYIHRLSDGGTMVHLGREWICLKDSFEEITEILLKADQQKRKKE